MIAKLAPHVIPYHNSWHMECAGYRAGITKVLDPDLGWCVAHKETTGNRILARLSTLSLPLDKLSPYQIAEEHLRVIRNHPASGAVDIWEFGNEPNTNCTPDELAHIALYELLMLQGCNAYNLTGAWGSFGVGHPVGTANNPIPDWSVFARCFAEAGDRHYLALHEYWPKMGPKNGWGWYAGRFTHVKQQCKIIITECGLNDELSYHDGKERGWKVSVDSSIYRVHLQAYLTLIRQDPRVLSAHVFTLDYASNVWDQFDVRGFGDYIGQINGPSAVVPPVMPPVTPPVPDLQLTLLQIGDSLTSAQRAIQQASDLLGTISKG